MKKGKNTHKNMKTAAKKLDKQEKVARKEERVFQLQKAARLDTLRGLRQMTEARIMIDTDALDRLISEVENATTPVSLYSVSVDTTE